MPINGVERMYCQTSTTNSSPHQLHHPHSQSLSDSSVLYIDAYPYLASSSSPAVTSSTTNSDSNYSNEIDEKSSALADRGASMHSPWGSTTTEQRSSHSNILDRFNKSASANITNIIDHHRSSDSLNDSLNEITGAGGRSSLGLLIERSTSAPPPRSSGFLSKSSGISNNQSSNMYTHQQEQTFATSYQHHGNDQTLLGNDLYELMSRDYAESEEGQVRNWRSSSDMNNQNLHSLESFLEGQPHGENDLKEGTPLEDDDLGILLNNGNGRSTAPATSYLQSSFGNDGLYMQRPLSASGGTSNSINGDRVPSESDDNNNNANVYVRGSHTGHSSLPAQGLFRSHSAAPTLLGNTSGGRLASLGPPPGLSLDQANSVQPHLSPVPLLTRRSASAGILADDGRSDHGHQQHAALRPAAKTLMDLIQEDYPNESRQTKDNHRNHQNIDGLKRQPDTRSIQVQTQQDELYNNSNNASIIQSISPRQELQHQQNLQIQQQPQQQQQHQQQYHQQNQQQYHQQHQQQQQQQLLPQQQQLQQQQQQQQQLQQQQQQQQQKQQQQQQQQQQQHQIECPSYMSSSTPHLQSETQYQVVQQLDHVPPQQYYHPQSQVQYENNVHANSQLQYHVVVDNQSNNGMYTPRQHQEPQQHILVSAQDQRHIVRAASAPIENSSRILRRLDSGTGGTLSQPIYTVQSQQRPPSHTTMMHSPFYGQSPSPPHNVQIDTTSPTPQIYYSSTTQPPPLQQQRSMQALSASIPPQHHIQHQSVQQHQPTSVHLSSNSGMTGLHHSHAAPSYGYTTVHYHHGPPPPQQQVQQQLQTHVLHPSLSGNNGYLSSDLQPQYVSVIPASNAPHQVTYWPPEVTPTAVVGPQNLGPATVTILNAAGVGGGPVTVARVVQSNVDTSHQHLSQQQPTYAMSAVPRRGDKGGRGRRGGSGGSNASGNVSRRGGADVKQSPHSLVSPLLDEFRLIKNRDWSMHQIAGHVVEFCQDQNGSRFIQQRLELGDPAEQQIVVCEVIPAIRRLRNDVFGNYVVQKLLDFGSPQVKMSIRDTLEGEMLQLSLQMYGCRVVQKALEALPEEDLPHLLLEFHHNVLSCIHDQNGNHVVQKCIEVMSNRARRAQNEGDEARADFLNEKIDFIIRDVLVNTATLSCHPYGCRVLQRILEHCEDGRKTKVLDEIMKCHRRLLDDQYGNYVIQHVLQFGRQIDRDSILLIVVEWGLLGLSRQKFASNVVEKLLKYGNSSQRRAIVREMLKRGDDPTVAATPALPSDGDSSVVLLMVRDAYANYVVQTTLDVVPDSDEKVRLLEELNFHADELRQYTFAKHIVAKLIALNSGSSNINNTNLE